MKSFQQYLFDLKRFGVAPDKLLAQATGQKRQAPRILTVTMPKSGTNLLQRILVLHPLLGRAWLPTLGQRNAEKWADPRKLLSGVGAGRIISTHFDYDEGLAQLIRDELGFKLLLMVRDPRDAVISDMHYIASWPGHPQKELLAGMSSDKERLLSLIEGRQGIRPVRDQILRFSDWSRYAHTLRFEDTVGAGGGGSDEAQFRMIQEMFAYLDLPMDDTTVRDYAARARSAKTQTFRTGRLGNWKEAFDDEVRDSFRRHAGDLLIELGYEKDLDW